MPQVQYEPGEKVLSQGTTVLGLTIPSNAPGFLIVVGVHVAAGLVCTIAGLVAMLAPKGAGRHPTSGTVYFWSLVVVFLTMGVLTILRWPADNMLFALGFMSFLSAWIGRRARRRHQPGWAPVHVTGMAVSYILLLTAFYVDNGPHLPFWRSLPPLAFWLLPGLVGLPILGWALLNHPVIRRPLGR